MAEGQGLRETNVSQDSKFKNIMYRPGAVVHTYNSSIQEVDIGRISV
jgi:hypothetical protein